MQKKEKKRDAFGSRLGFILVSAGCAIGLGNVWKFPYVMGQNGGAGFTLIYLLFLVILGIPLMTMEFSTGRRSRASIATGFKKIEQEGSKYHIYGYIGVAGNYLVMMFYTTIAGWMLYYLYEMLNGGLTNMSTTEVTATFNTLLDSPLTLIFWMTLVVTVSFSVTLIGLKNGVEKVSKVMMTSLLILMIVMVVRSVTLPGAEKGLEFFLKPDFGKMKEIGFGNLMFAALGQAFFTLSVGMGSMMVFGSYADKTRSLTGEAVTITALDTFVAIMAGFIIIPACFSYGIEPGAGPGLIFITLPNVFNAMPGGRIWGSLFFLFLSFAALSTVIAIFENLISFFIDLFGFSRKKSVFINFIMILLLSIPCILGFNLLSNFHPFGQTSNVLSLEDFILSQNILPLGSLIFLFFSVSKYGYGYDKFIEEANTGEGIKFPSKLKWYFLYIVPLLIMFVYIKGYYEFFISEGLNGIVGICISLLILLFLAYICFYNSKKYRKIKKK